MQAVTQALYKTQKINVLFAVHVDIYNSVAPSCHLVRQALMQ